MPQGVTPPAQLRIVPASVDHAFCPAAVLGVENEVGRAARAVAP